MADEKNIAVFTLERCRVPNAFLLASLLLLANCSTSSQDLERQKSTQIETRNYATNYQEIFKRILDNGKRCSEGGLMFGMGASLAVDGQLYNELGLGEITFSLINVGVRNYYWKAKIEKADGGTKLTIFSGNTLNNRTWIRKVTGWADGETNC